MSSTPHHPLDILYAMITVCIHHRCSELAEWKHISCRASSCSNMRLLCRAIAQAVSYSNVFTSVSADARLMFSLAMVLLGCSLYVMKVLKIRSLNPLSRFEG